jgi:phosphoadenosine phosphosulfate reductase
VGPTVIEALDHFSPARPPTALPLRLPVQAVYKFDDRRIVAGRIESGGIAVGDEIVVSPSGKVAKVRSIEAWPETDQIGATEATAGRSVGITLDRELFITRGDVIAASAQPAPVGRRIRARVFWLHDQPLSAGTFVTVRVGTAEARGTITAIEKALDPGTPDMARTDTVGQNHVGEIEIALSSAIAVDLFEANPRTGRIVLDLGGRIAGGGLVLKVESDAVIRVVAEPAARHDALTARADALGRALSGLDVTRRLAGFRRDVDGAIVFTTSFGLEDQVVLHHICEAGLDIDVVTLDTGRLFPETYATWEETEQRYGRRIRAIYPQHTALEALVAAQGVNGFFGSRDARIACCDIRKVEPLNRALAGARGWITGLRADQSEHRRRAGLVDVDPQRGVLKLNPLIDWSRDATQAFAVAHLVPTNPLHQRGFASIGCAPCTRAVRPGEPERSGRWWWEDETKKECGLHLAIAAAR